MFKLILDDRAYTFKSRDSACRYYRNVAKKEVDEKLKGILNNIVCHIKMTSPDAEEMQLNGFFEEIK